MLIIRVVNDVFKVCGKNYGKIEIPSEKTQQAILSSTLLIYS